MEKEICPISDIEKKLNILLWLIVCDKFPIDTNKYTALKIAIENENDFSIEQVFEVLRTSQLHKNLF